MRALTLATVALLLGLPAMAYGDGVTPARVVSVTGKVTANGKPMAATDTQLSAIAPGTALQVTGGAVAQLMLRGGLSVGLMGQVQVIVGGKAADVELHQLAGAVRMGGAGGSLTVKGWRVELAPTGASVILHGSRLYVLEGTALVRMPRVVAPKPVAATTDTEPGQPGGPGTGTNSGTGTTVSAVPPVAVLPTTTTLAAGKAMALGQKIVPATAGVTPSTAVLRATSSHGMPAPWKPGLGGVSLQDVQQARVWMQAERQAQRETAACGCTEGGGAQGGALGGKGVETGNVQKTITVIKIRIDGLPKKGK